MAQELSPADYAIRRNMCEQFLAQIPLQATFFTIFATGLEITSNLFNITHSPKLTVWCAVSPRDTSLSREVDVIF